MLSAPVKSAYESLSQDLRETLLSEMGLETAPDSDEAVNEFALNIIKKYFPYLLQTKSQECQNAPLKVFNEEHAFFHNKYPKISIRQLLRAFSGESKEEILATNQIDNEIPVLKGILLANDSQIPLFSDEDYYLQRSQKITAITCAIRQRDFTKVKTLAGSFPVEGSEYFVTLAMALEDAEIALYFHRQDKEAKPDDFEQMLLNIGRYDNDAAFLNTAKRPEISIAFLVKELFDVDVVPRVRIGLLKALHDKYQAANTNHWLSTFLGRGDSIWKLKGKCYFDYKINTVSLLIWSMHQGNDGLIGGFLKVADRNAADWNFACHAKVEALHFAVQHGRTGVLKVILEDTNIPLSVKDKERALALAKDPISCQILHDSIQEQKGEKDMPVNTSITFAFKNNQTRQSSVDVATTPSSSLRQRNANF